ncbi:hypothetical protein MHLP_03310 [Candidatus Mycoplasma haematolamae str. Purdue]|uniref:Uncharacterized protein n=1 Tax=Mycoplasma haematolamae (strain Purdue) TaxID=1212765 RepID=I7C6T0_MYCHA|nr:hypothetical protein [Candidatus Mycoplasma haematolamae]AFO52242.1 hypothetical protein MHLP_03310 [Candidatus Mycoplasma haematolamae str. Purdue]
MFHFSRLVGISLGGLTAGSTGIAVTPTLLRDALFLDSLYKEEKKTKSSFDLDGLRKEDQKTKSALDKLNSQLNQGLSAIETLKTRQVSLIKAGFSSIEKKEEEFRQKYDSLSKKIQSLTELLKQESSIASKKMNVQQNLQLLSIYEKAFDQLNNQFYSWDSTIQEIICVLKEPTKNEENKCKGEGLIAPLRNMFREDEKSSRLFGSSTTVAGGAPSRTTRSTRDTSQVEATASQTAMAELEKVRQALEQMSKNLENSWKESLKKKGETMSHKSKLQNYQAYLEYAQALTDFQRVLLKGKVTEDTEASRELVKTINDLTEFIVRVGRALENLKAHYVVLKAYEGKIATSLCNLKTIPREGCETPSTEEL